MRVLNHHSERQMQLLADQEPRAAIAKRLRTIVLAKRSYTAPEIATCTGFSRRVVQAWVARYNGEGLAGLETKAGRGRKPPLTPEEADQLQQRLDAGPLPDDGVCTDELAAVLIRAESSRESVALPAEPSLVEPKIRHRG